MVSFCSGCSTTDQVFTHKEMEYAKDVYACFVDLKST